MKLFSEKVALVVASIPSGKTLSYSEVAKRAGFPRAARAVGSYLRKNYDPTIPYHRVICADGRLGNYNRGGTEMKILLLRAEGAIE
ncbi:MAG: MGMT family protein [Candidatus Moranbacteria bacterium]|nr:MGMT family protein [Candidatus Moranbacteria bacterium]